MSGTCILIPWRKRQHRKEKSTGKYPAGNTTECSPGHNGSWSAEENQGANDHMQKFAWEDVSNKK